jgi:hypothetical protein
MRNGPCRWKALRVEEAMSGHAGVGEAALAALAREGPREGVDTAHRKPERETRQERQRLAASAARGRTRPARSRRAPDGADAARRSEGSGHVMTPLPRQRGGSQNPSLPLGAQAPGMHREPASTGTRSREFGKQTSVGRIGECLVGEALQGAAANQVPSPKETVTPLGQNPDDGGRRREGENGAQSSRVSFTSFARRSDSWAERHAKA